MCQGRLPSQLPKDALVGPGVAMCDDKKNLYFSLQLKKKKTGCPPQGKPLGAESFQAVTSRRAGLQLCTAISRNRNGLTSGACDSGASFGTHLIPRLTGWLIHSIHEMIPG